MARCSATMGKLLLLAAISVSLHRVYFDGFSKSKNIKYILMWTYKDLHMFEEWKTGQEIFLEGECPESDCYLTSRRDFFGEDVTKFDAIIFNGRNLYRWMPLDLPKMRSPNQKYIFFNIESSSNEPICSPVFDAFFNLTATYKLDSDIVYSYVLINDLLGREVGPTINMTWVDPMTPINQKFTKALKKKSKAVAWFVSHCKTRGQREKYARKLKRALEKYDLVLDTYGACGDLECPKIEEQKCRNMLKDDYYFYLSFENSFAEDYVTEKLLTALKNDVVPIVYGGANYSRFLPPGSYLDAMSHSPKKLAALIAYIIGSSDEYYNFFKWRNHYTYGAPKNLCRLCSVLSNETVQDSYKVYKDFRTWWNPDYEERCGHCRLCHQISEASTLCATPWFIVLLFFIKIL